MDLRISKREVADVDLSGLFRHAEWNRDFFCYFANAPPGAEHYRLLGHLSRALGPGMLAIDVGTCFGYSALALALDPRNRVVSYDVVDRIPHGRGATARDRANVELRIGDCVPDLAAWVAAGAGLVMIDVDHRGDDEARIMQALRDAGYRGLVLLDDIDLNPEMQAFWGAIPERKLDLTSVGHSTGTGLVVFDPERVRVSLDQRQ